jgi:hypothetical protein
MPRLTRRLHHSVGVKKTERSQKKMATYPRIDEELMKCVQRFFGISVG